MTVYPICHINTLFFSDYYCEAALTVRNKSDLTWFLGSVTRQNQYQMSVSQ